MAMTMTIGVEFVMKDSFSAPATKITSAFQSLKTSVTGLTSMQGQFTSFAQSVQQGTTAMTRGMRGAGGGARGGGGGVRAGGGGGGGGGGLTALHDTLGGVATAFVALKGVTAGFTAFDSVASAAGAFGKQLASARAIMNASEADLKKLEAAAIDAGINTQFSPKEAVEGLELLGQSGFNATQAIKLLNPTLDLAAGGQLSVAQASATTSAAIKVFGLSMEDASLATDKMLRISNATSLAASDLELGFANVSRGAVATGQSIDEMLVAMGLVKNTGADVSVASSSVSSALLAMAKNAGKFKSDLGVDITDAAGKFRPLMSVMFDVDQALSAMPNEAERSAKAMELFGKFGLTAFSAISKQLSTGVTINEQLYTAEDAINELRKTMSTAGGAAADFRGKLLDTFEGQRTLLRGSVETLMVVVGKPLTQALRPMVEMAINGINRLISFVQSMPESMKTAMAKVAVVIAVLGGIATAALGVAAALSFVGPKIATIAGAIASAWPALLGIAGALVGIGLGTAAMKVAVENDLGGIATYFTEKIAQVRLAVDALWQLFTTGAVRGDAASALMDPANEGVLNFVTNLYTAGSRIMNFFDGLKSGFTDTVKAAEPIFANFRVAVEELAGQFDGLSSAMDPSATKAAFDSAGESGKSVGTTLGQMAAMVIRGVTGIIEVVTTAASKWESFKTAMAPIGEALSGIGTVLSDIGKEFGTTSTEGQSFVSVVGFIIQGIANVITAVGHVMGATLSMFRGVINIFMGVINIIDGVIHGRWGQVWKGMAQIVYGVVTAIVGFIGGMVQAVASGVDSLARAFGVDLGLAGFIGDFKNTLDKEFKMALGLEARPWEGPSAEAAPVMSAPEDQLFATEAAANGAYTPAAASSEMSSAGSEALVSSIEGMGGKLDALGKRPVTVRAEIDLNVDGQTLASVVADAQTSSDDLSSSI